MNTVCTHCQAINRIPDDRIEDAAKCGRCGHDLFDGEVINATGETLDKLLKDDLPVVISTSGHRGAAPAVISHQFLKMSRKSVAVKCAL